MDYCRSVYSGTHLYHSDKIWCQTSLGDKIPPFGFVWKIRVTEIENSKDQKERVMFPGQH